jgi:hypothetical protein
MKERSLRIRPSRLSRIRKGAKLTIEVAVRDLLGAGATARARTRLR